MNKTVVGGLMALLLGAVPAFSATIDVGNHVLFEDMADQQIQISVVPGDPVEQTAGMDLFAQIGDGGPSLPPPVTGTIDGPEFTGADMETGTIWTDPVPTPIDIWPGGQVLVGGIVLRTSGSTVPADGLLVTLTVDTTGFFATDGNNPWELKLDQTIDPAGTALLDNSVPSPQPIPLDITNGTITLVPIPEPSTIVMLLGVLAGVPFLFALRLRQRAS